MDAIATLLARLHAWLATASAVIAGLVVVLGTLDGAGLVRARAWLDRLVVVLFVTLVAVVLLGPGIVVGIGGPADPLHFVYAAVALVAVPLLRFLAARRESAGAGWWMAAGGLVTLGMLYLLWQSGA
jgi:hypothetical protein